MNKGDDKKKAALDSSVIDRSIREKESSDLPNRLKRAIGDEKVAPFARRAGVSESVMRAYLSGEKRPGIDNLHGIAAAAGVSIDYLVTGRSVSLKSDEARPAKAEEPGLPYVSTNDFVYLPLHRNVSASAGNGSVVWDEHDIDHLAFQASFIRQELHANPQSLRLVRINGDSMERLLYSGDMVMVDTSITTLQAEGMYVFRIDDSISVKWLNAMPGGVIRVVSENSVKYPPYEITREQADDHRFQIIGLVRWWAHTQR
jgi:phage repressor protein C with HTH and peptisase S24 domain